jgi:hypothetical protein
LLANASGWDIPQTSIVLIASYQGREIPLSVIDALLPNGVYSDI